MTVERLPFALNSNLLPVRFNNGISFISSSLESAICLYINNNEKNPQELTIDLLNSICYTGDFNFHSHLTNFGQATITDERFAKYNISRIFDSKEVEIYECAELQADLISETLNGVYCRYATEIDLNSLFFHLNNIYDEFINPQSVGFNASLVYKANNDDVELIQRVTGDKTINNGYQLINLDTLFPLLVDSYKQALTRFIDEDKLGACSIK
jgi:hypothetical protein